MEIHQEIEKQSGFVGLNRSNLSKLGYVMYNINPLMNEKLGCMDFIIHEKDASFMIFDNAQIMILTPPKNRSFILSDISMYIQGKDCFISSIRNIPLEKDSFGLFSIAGDGDMYFMLPIHPKYLLVYKINQKLISDKSIQLVLFTQKVDEEDLNRLNQNILNNSIKYTIGLQEELERFLNKN
jgi:hypothetical protein